MIQASGLLYILYVVHSQALPLGQVVDPEYIGCFCYAKPPTPQTMFSSKSLIHSRRKRKKQRRQVSYCDIIERGQGHTAVGNLS